MSLLGIKQSTRNFRLTTMALLSVVTGLALAIRNVAFVVNLSGAIFGALTVYIFPCLLYLWIPNRKASAEAQFARVTVGGGVLLAVLGSVVAVLQEFAPGRLR
uniref:Amino acid transporter transmembrane domain-containing protein n=2 Tax=Alexandrium andersonii TaxID=327968 RepID=A0A7S2D1K8_9DINO|mmetsp:Transcript_45357/g.103043  ORF Transcript_45357/g.103043 Transcript_45357/m.103043 type:complete len:103 (+) Transcript_45357:100-408(+)